MPVFGDKICSNCEDRHQRVNCNFRARHAQHAQHAQHSLCWFCIIGLMRETEFFTCEIRFSRIINTSKENTECFRRIIVSFLTNYNSPVDVCPQSWNTFCLRMAYDAFLSYYDFEDTPRSKSITRYNLPVSAFRLLLGLSHLLHHMWQLVLRCQQQNMAQLQQRMAEELSSILVKT
jgi:hypothetical protein